MRRSQPRMAPSARLASGCTTTLFIEELANAQAVAGRAGAGRVVEGEQLGFEFADAVAADWGRRSAQRTRDRLVAVRLHVAMEASPSVRLSAVSKDSASRSLQVRAHLEAVDDDFDGVLLVLFQLRHVVEIVTMPSMRARMKPLARSSSNTCRCSPLRFAHDRRQQHQLAAFRHASTVSTIWLTVWASSGRSCSGSAVRRCGRRAGAGSRRSR